MVSSRPSGLVGIGAGLAAAGVGAVLGLAAERWTLGRARAGGVAEPFGSLRGKSRRVIADDGTPLYVEVDEPADFGAKVSSAPVVTVVFSHGFCLNLDAWHYQRQALRGRYRLVLWDQRGHGRSGVGQPGSCTVDQCGRDLLQVLTAVAPKGPLVLVGHSMGGMTQMAFGAEQHPIVAERVVGVALIATSSGGLADVHWGLTGVVGQVAHKLAPATLAGLARTPRLVDRTRRLASDFEQAVVKRYSYASPVSASLVRFSAAMISATPIEVVAEYLPTFDLHDKREALDAFNGIEALVLSGQEDLLTPPEHSTEIVRHLPGAEHVLVADAGHLVMLERPDEVNLHLDTLLVRAARALERAAASSARQPRQAGPRRRPQ